MRIVILLWALVSVASAQTDGTAKAPKTSRSLESLRTVVDPLEKAIGEVDALRAKLKKAATEEEKQDLRNSIQSARERVEQLRGHFRDIVGGAEAAGYKVTEPEKKSAQEQLGELLEPLLGELRDATSLPREMDGLRKDLEVWKDRKLRCEAVIARIDRITSMAEDETLLSELADARRLWTDRLADATGEIGVLDVRIEELEDRKRPMWETVSGTVARFFRSRGVNLLLAVIAAVAGFILTTRIYRYVRKVSPVHRGKPSLTSRISDILAMAGAVLVAVLAVLLVFYARGDWLLLTIAVILLVGAAWAGKTALPPYLEQIRMILNLGPVREGERLILRGLPWKVEAIGFYTRLTNPNLQGGELRLPIRDLMGMVSRAPDDHEPWFPTQPDEWVLLGDGTYGKTVTQTPENVVLLRIGGSRKTYATEAFLEQTPENLSHGFRVSAAFGIDYVHQAVAVDEVPEILTRMLTESLFGDFGRDAVRSVQVEFANAGASSLDYDILADFDGSVASRLGPIRRRIQQCMVRACNEHGWVIPFTQITVHEAAPGE
ncbi:MAG: hypothetical protein KDN05_10025 [Verrucomicrobiae bacterium]|nr:hypothetical protein [Verrucomicrobiae bacterium]